MASSLHDHVLNSLAHRIVSGELRAGSVLRLDDVAQSYGVSRSVARGAAQVLSSMGLVQARTRVGITVQPAHEWDPYNPTVLVLRAEGPAQTEVLGDIGQLRLAIEPSAARLAASAATPEQCAAMGEAVAVMATVRRTSAPEDFLDADVTFHRTLLVASGNFLFAGLADTIGAYLVARSQNELLPDDPGPASVARHADLLAAIISRDPIRSERLSRELVEEALDLRRHGREDEGVVVN